MASNNKREKEGVDASREKKCVRSTIFYVMTGSFTPVEECDSRSAVRACRMDALS